MNSDDSTTDRVQCAQCCICASLRASRHSCCCPQWSHRCWKCAWSRTHFSVAICHCHLFVNFCIRRYCIYILPKCPHINHVKETAVCVREIFELGAHKLFSLISNDHQRKTKILDAPLCDTLCQSLSSLVHNRNTQLVQRTPTHHVAENDFGTVWRLDLKKGPNQVFSLKRKVRGNAAGSLGFGG